MRGGDENGVASGDEILLQIGGDTVEHLNSNGPGDAYAVGVVDNRVDDPAVVGGDAGIAVVGQHFFGEDEVAGIDIGLLSDRRRSGGSR